MISNFRKLVLRVSKHNNHWRQIRLMSTTVTVNAKTGTNQNDNDTETECEMPFSHSRIGPFFQKMPVLGNQFNEDITLKTYLQRTMPEKVRCFANNKL